MKIKIISILLLTMIFCSNYSNAQNIYLTLPNQYTTRLSSIILAIGNTVTNSKNDHFLNLVYIEIINKKIIICGYAKRNDKSEQQRSEFVFAVVSKFMELLEIKGIATNVLLSSAKKANIFNRDTIIYKVSSFSNENTYLRNTSELLVKYDKNEIISMLSKYANESSIEINMIKFITKSKTDSYTEYKICISGNGYYMNVLYYINIFEQLIKHDITKTYVSIETLNKSLNSDGMTKFYVSLIYYNSNLLSTNIDKLLPSISSSIKNIMINPFIEIK